MAPPARQASVFSWTPIAYVTAAALAGGTTMALLVAAHTGPGTRIVAFTADPANATGGARTGKTAVPATAMGCLPPGVRVEHASNDAVYCSRAGASDCIVFIEVYTPIDY